MKIKSDPGEGFIRLTDEQISHLMSALAFATVYWDCSVEEDNSTTAEDLMDVSISILEQYSGDDIKNILDQVDDPEGPEVEKKIDEVVKKTGDNIKKQQLNEILKKMEGDK